MDRFANGVNEDGKPKQPVTYKIGSGWKPGLLLSIADVNGDGNPDILGTDSEGKLMAYIHTGTFVREPGQGQRTFADPVSVGPGWNGMDLIT
ncbi:hypothetical protein [Sciscionella sediminilitoris]|uniref:hypothetical protein n=1 Tax=Sciscionella sediminilitoris TaxID=1445613 RepID=UPI0004DFA75C|nr:hypothetical protein [Sciscionella sp. SE31]